AVGARRRRRARRGGHQRRAHRPARDPGNDPGRRGGVGGHGDGDLDRRTAAGPAVPAPRRAGAAGHAGGGVRAGHGVVAPGAGGRRRPRRLARGAGGGPVPGHAGRTGRQQPARRPARRPVAAPGRADRGGPGRGGCGGPGPGLSPRRRGGQDGGVARRDPLDDYRHLNDPARRRLVERHGDFFVAEGIVALRALLESPYPVRSVLVTRRKADRVRALVAGRAPVLVRDDDEVAAVAGFHVHRGVLAAADRLPLPAADELLAGARLVVVTEGL